MKQLLKKFWHKFFINENGAVSVYLIIIALLLLLFNAVLIDYARILVAERQTEEAAKTAIRSTMSAYNGSLQGKGLFGLNGDQASAEAIFKKVFQKNLSTGEGEHFDFLGLKPVENEISLSLDMGRTLANKDILRYQILEEMKYKAPIEVGEAIITNFLSVSEQVEEASNYAKIAKELNGDAKKREGKLDDVKKLLDEAENLLDSMEGRVHHNSSSTYPNVKVLADILAHHSQYLQDLDDIADAEANDDEEVDVDELRERTEKYIQESLDLVDNLVTITTNAADKLDQALILIEEARVINEEMQQKIENHESSGTSGNYENAKNISEQLNDSTVKENTEGTLNDFVYEDKMFNDLKNAVEAAHEALTTESSTNTGALLEKLSKDLKRYINNFDPSAINRAITQSRNYHRTASNKVSESLTLLSEGRKKYIDNKAKIEEKEKEADQGMNDSKKQMDEVLQKIENSALVAEDSMRLIQLGQKAREYGDAIQANNEEFSMEDRDDTADQAMSFVDMLFNNIGDMLLNARDEVYINEYILLRFKSHDFKLNGAEAYTFANNQVEYILYGQEVHGMNYFAALSEIFAVRFAINFAAGLMKPEGKLFGPFMWAYALSYSFTRTSADMAKITQGQSIPLWPNSFKPMVNYQDHLRLFLFVHPEGSKFNRLMAVIDNDTVQDLEERSTYSTAKATATLDLWFLPQVINILESTNVINGRVEGNKFFIEKEVNFSY